MRKPWHCWVIDIDLGNGPGGIDLLRLHNRFPFAVVVSGLDDMEAAAEAMKAGARDVLRKGSNGLGPRVTHTIFRKAALGFVLRGMRAQCPPEFLLLRENVITSVQEWAGRACKSVRQVENICSLCTGLSPERAMALYYCVCSCLCMTSDIALADSGWRESAIRACCNYLSSCVDFVYERMDTVYADMLRAYP